MLPTAHQWEPRAFYGAPGVVTAFFGYFFGLLQKSASPVGRDPQGLNKRRSK